MTGVMRNAELNGLEQFAVATGERSPEVLRVLKEGDSFAVFDQRGDVVPDVAAEAGFYHAGTRFISRWELLLYGRRPLRLSSTISDDNAGFVADLTNGDLHDGGAIIIGHGQIHIARARTVQGSHFCERVRITNYGPDAVDAPVAFRFGSDFADVFEVRGTIRDRRGEHLGTESQADTHVLRYRGLDGVDRRSRIRFSAAPDSVDGNVVGYGLHLEPHRTHELCVTISCEVGEATATGPWFETALARTRATFAERAMNGAALNSSSAALTRWLGRSTADLHMMLTDTPHGVYPYAGIPWFNAPFGRDGIITAWQLLWAAPALARGVLAFLAATQATVRDHSRDAQPGKIVHEMRTGEMAALGEVPFGCYYGTVDATPLFVVLAHAYHSRTGDRAFVDVLWPHIVAALDWIATDGDPDGDGFVEYARQSQRGLVQQGWKDSFDSVMHADGTLAEPPIALCEVQGYVYAAWSGAAELARARGDYATADEWRRRAERLRESFEAAFWCEELGTYALALDGQKRPCRVRTSNPAHALFTGIAAPERARRVAASLLDSPSFSGWGVRTLARGQARYNPMAYHDGSIWPHDNSIVAAGLARYGFMSEATRILDGMLDLSAAVDLHRMPELICGFERHDREFPTLYPVACAPQSWAAGAVYLLLQACLGLDVDAIRRRVTFNRAMLPESIDWLRITTLRVGESTVDLLLERHPHDVGVTVLQRRGPVEIVAMK